MQTSINISECGVSIISYLCSIFHVYNDIIFMRKSYINSFQVLKRVIIEIIHQKSTMIPVEKNMLISKLWIIIIIFYGIYYYVTNNNQL